MFYDVFDSTNIGHKNGMFCGPLERNACFQGNRHDLKKNRSFYGGRRTILKTITVWVQRGGYIGLRSGESYILNDNWIIRRVTKWNISTVFRQEFCGWFAKFRFGFHASTRMLSALGQPMTAKSVKASYRSLSSLHTILSLVWFNNLTD